MDIFDDLALAFPAQWHTHEPSPKQRQFLDLDCLEALYGGAAGGGKSDALLQSALKYFDVPGYSAIIFRRTYKDLALPGAIMDRAHQWLRGSGAHWNDDNKCFTSPQGAKLTFGYLEAPRDHLRYQGAEFQFVGFDELSQFFVKQYLYMFSRLRRLVNSRIPIRMRGATNPGDIGHAWIQERWGIPDDGCTQMHWHRERAFVPALARDNPHIDLAEYTKALAELDPITRAQLEEGKWFVDGSGLVYKYNPRIQLVPHMPALPDGEEWIRVFSADFGVTDHTAFAVHCFSEHAPEIYLCESGQWPGLSPSEAAELYQSWEVRHGGFESSIGDIGGLGKAFAEEWRKRFAIPLEPADKQNKLGYIKLMNGDMTNSRYKVVEATNQGWIECARKLPWKDDKHQVEHPAFPNHLTDASLYGWRKCRHWNWAERVHKPKPGTAEAWQAEMEERMAREDERTRMEEAGLFVPQW